MRRTLIQFDEQTYQKLRQRAFRQSRSLASVVRELVARGLEGERGPARLRQFSSVRAGRSKQGRLSPVSEKHDRALAKALEK